MSKGRRGSSTRRIYVVFKSHLDVGFTGLVAEVLDTYTQVMVPRALEACRQSMEADPLHPFTWTLPAWLLERCLRDLEGSPGGEELKRRVGEGRISWHALPLTTHTESLGLEDLIRGLYVARRLSRRFGRVAVAAKMTDVPGHTWILPTLLCAAGISFLHLGCNPCSTPPDVPRLFSWEGPDGSRVTTMYSQGGYGTPLLPPEDWDLPVWLALQHTSDNMGPQGAEAIPALLAAVREKLPEAEVTIGTLDDFARALAALKPRLPVVRKDLADSWIHGVGSMPVEMARVRMLRNRLAALESSAALRLALGPHGEAGLDEPADTATAAYENLLLFGEHTWGMDTKLGLNPPERGGRIYDKGRFHRALQAGSYERIVHSWDDKRAFVSAAAADVQRLDSLSGEPAVLPALLEITNHHLWEWNGLVPLGIRGDEISAVSVTDGAELPTVAIDGESWAMVRGLAPLSRAHLEVQRASGRAAGPPRRGPAVSREKGDSLVLENDLVRVRVGRSAGIVSLVDRRSGREWVDRRAPVAFGAYRYDVYARREIVAYLKSYAYDLEPWFLDDFGKPGYPAGEHLTFLGTLSGVQAESGTGWVRARLTWSQDPESTRELGNAAEVLQTVTVFDDQPFVDLTCALTGKEETPLLEAGHFVLPLRAGTPRYAINKTGSVVDPAVDIARGANRLLHCCDRWVDVSEDGQGLLVIPMDSPLVSIGSPAIERFDGSGGPEGPTLYFNLFNTQWGTNFPQWIGPTPRYRFRLVPHRGTWRTGRAWEHAAAAFQPPICRISSEHHPDRAFSLLKVTGLPLETVTLKRSEAGDGTILRLRDPSGRAGSRTLHFYRAPETNSRPAAPQLILCSLLEDEQKRLALAPSAGSWRAELSLRPFEIVTLKLKA